MSPIFLRMMRHTKSVLTNNSDLTFKYSETIIDSPHFVGV